MTLLVVSNLMLWMVVACLILTTIILVRQVGLLHHRLGPMGARMELEGLKVGAPAPQFRETSIQGSIVDLAIGRARATLLIFVSPGCSLCGTLMPAIKNIHRRERALVEVVLVSLVSGLEVNRVYAAENGLHDIPYLVSQDLAERYEVKSPPYAIIVGRDGTIKAKGLINHLEHLESLVNAEESGYSTVEEFSRAKSGSLTPVPSAE